MITEFDIYHIFWGGKSYKLPLKVQEKLDYSARSSVLVTNFCSARSLWFWHFRPSLALSLSRRRAPAANNLHRGGPHIRSLVELETKVNTKVRKIYVMIMIICVDLRFKLYSLGLLCSKQAQLHLEVTGHHFAMLYVWQIQWELTGADGKALITYSLMLGKFCKMFLNQWKKIWRRSPLLTSTATTRKFPSYSSYRLGKELRIFIMIKMELSIIKRFPGNPYSD